MLQPALPFGTYKVCAESRTPESSPSSQLRKREITGVNNFYYHGMKSPDVVSPVIDLKGTGSTGACT
jgi:hypothetical protein